MNFTEKLRTAHFECKLDMHEGVEKLKNNLVDFFYPMHRLATKIIKIVKFIPTICKDEDWDEAYLLFLMKHKLVNMRDYLTSGILQASDKRDIAIQINQVIDHIDNFLNPDEKFDEIYGKCSVNLAHKFEPCEDNEEYNKLVWLNVDTGMTLSERENLLFADYVGKKHLFEQQEWNAIWDTIKKYGQGWWD